MRISREVCETLLGRDDVVGLGDELLEGPGNTGIEAKGVERPHDGHDRQPNLPVVARVRTLPQAAAWIDRVGLALLFPKADVVLPSLWEQVNGSPLENWAVRDVDGTFVGWTRELAFLWRTKDELPGRRLACVGKHLARVVACISPAYVPTLVAAAGPQELDGVEAAVVDAVRENGPLTAPQLRHLLGLEKKDVERTLALLHRRLVLTHSHLVEDGDGWGKLAHELLERKWQLPKRLPAQEDARRTLARCVLAAAGELTAADLGGALGWRRTEAERVLDDVAESRDADGYRIWAAP